jgi:hypothetical protein
MARTTNKNPGDSAGYEAQLWPTADATQVGLENNSEHMAPAGVASLELLNSSISSESRR